MSKIISWFVSLLAICIALSSVVEALRFMPPHNNHLHQEQQSIEKIKKGSRYDARRQISERMRAAHKNGKMMEYLGKFQGGDDCGTCEFEVGAIVDILTNPLLENVTIATIDEEVCSKKFNTTKDRELCDKIAGFLIDILGKLGQKAENGGWNLAADICSDFLGKCFSPCCVSPYTPEQILLNYANSGQIVSDSMQMRVTWLTLNQTTADFIYFREAGASSWTVVTDVTQQEFTGFWSFSWFGKFHSGVMGNLKPGTTYQYYVGSTSGTSPTYNFTTLPSNVGTTARPLRVAAVADIGTKNSQETLSGILARAQAGQIDMLFMIGDLGYWDGYMERFAVFGRMLEPISTIIPVHTICGNHEGGVPNFTEYRLRYQMPLAGGIAPSNSLYYQISVGPVNMFFFNSETWFDTPDLDAVQMDWAKPLLAKANQNQGQFTAVFHHRPLYCSTGGSPCFNGSDSNLLRMQAEHIYTTNKVDFVFSGHVHNLETMYPIKEGVVQGTNFNFPTAPVYGVFGNAGQQESAAQFHDGPYPWDRVRSTVWGYTLLEFAQGISSLDGKVHTALNMTALQSSNGNVLDNYLLTSSR